MEPVVLVTAERERYSCVLPTSARGGSNEVSATFGLVNGSSSSKKM